MEENIGYYQTNVPSRLDRLRRWLFPRQPWPFIENDQRTYLTTNVRLSVGWVDRVRLLATGRALVQVITYTDVEVKEAESRSAFSVEPR
jgi:hypothetical protein